LKTRSDTPDWKIEFLKSAARDLRKLEEIDRRRVIGKIEALAADPYAGDKLSGRFAGLWKVRAGRFRIIYDIEKSAITILIIRIADRKEAYLLPG